jgi:hypothetical protein
VLPAAATLFYICIVIALILVVVGVFKKHLFYYPMYGV